MTQFDYKINQGLAKRAIESMDITNRSFSGVIMTDTVDGKRTQRVGIPRTIMKQ